MGQQMRCLERCQAEPDRDQVLVFMADPKVALAQEENAQTMTIIKLGKEWIWLTWKIVAMTLWQNHVIWSKLNH